MKSLLRLLVLFALLTAGAFASERTMIGENIYVAEDEELGEVICVGCSIHIAGKVQTAVAIGGAILVEGEVEEEAVAIAGALQIPGKVGGEAVVVVGGMEVPGSVGAEAIVLLGGMRVAGRIGGEAIAVVGGINLLPGAEVRSDAIAILGGVTGVEDAIVVGSIESSENLRPVAIVAAVIFVAILLLVAVAAWPLLALLTYAMLSEQRAFVLKETVSRRAGMSFLLGLGISVSWVVLPIALFWVPLLEFPLTLIYLALAAVGYVGISLWVGRGFVRTGSAGGSVALGALIVSVIQLIPIVGWIAWWIFSQMAMGAAVLSGFGTSIDFLFRRSEIEPIPRPAANP